MFSLNSRPLSVAKSLVRPALVAACLWAAVAGGPTAEVAAFSIGEEIPTLADSGEEIPSLASRSGGNVELTK